MRARGTIEDEGPHVHERSRVDSDDETWRFAKTKMRREVAVMTDMRRVPRKNVGNVMSLDGGHSGS